MTVKEFKEDLENVLRRAIEFAEHNWTNYDQVLGAKMLSEHLFKHFAGDKNEKVD